MYMAETTHHIIITVKECLPHPTLLNIHSESTIVNTVFVL